MMSAATASAGVGIGGGRSKFPFTATQWQELEHQALVFKYMSAGIPIPPDLLSFIKRSLYSSNLFPYPPSSLGWNPYQMGYGKKIDPEPGRCRRTDGKKWRCSKEAYPDSKYCERHMHRGKNRSRKPVENNTNTNTNNIINNTNSSTFNSVSPVSLVNSSNNLIISTATTNNNNNNNTSSATYTHHSLLSTPKTHPSSLYSFPSSDASYNSLYSFSNKDYSRERYIHGLREEIGEHAFFGENSGSTLRGYSTPCIDESWPLGGSSSVNLDQSKHDGGGYPNYLQQLQSSNNNSDNNTNNDHTKQQQEKQCYIWGRDFNCDLSMKVVEQGRDINSDKTIHHFFDEWPLKTNGGANNDGRDSSSTTHLSISIPTSTSQHDFFLSNSRSHHDG